MWDSKYTVCVQDIDTLMYICMLVFWCTCLYYWKGDNEFELVGVVILGHTNVSYTYFAYTHTHVHKYNRRY